MTDTIQTAYGAAVVSMRALGAEIEYRNGYYFATAPGRLRGAAVDFPFVSVMGTENAMLAATLADGHTVIRPAAQEPEVDDWLATDKGGKAVDEEVAEAQKNQISGVPNFTIQGKYEVGGAQDPEVFVRLFEKIKAAEAAKA